MRADRAVEPDSDPSRGNLRSKLRSLTGVSLDGFFISTLAGHLPIARACMGCEVENTGQSDTLIASRPACLRGTGEDTRYRGGTSLVSMNRSVQRTLALSHG